jgi:hypothetical protein
MGGQDPASTADCQLDRHATTAEERVNQVQFVEFPPQTQILGTLQPRLVVKGERDTPSNSHCRCSVKWGCCGSIHRRRWSSDKASSFSEKVQLHFELAHLLVEFVLSRRRLAGASVRGRCRIRPANRPAPVSSSHQLASGEHEHLRDLGGCLVALDGLDGHFGLQAGWVTLAPSGGIASLHFQCRPPF